MATRKTTSTNARNRAALDEFCGLTYVLNLVGGRWKMLILDKLGRGVRRYSALKRTLPHITDRMLALQLRELESDGLVTRTVFAEVPPRVEYQLTESGAELANAFGALEAWGNTYRLTTDQSESQV